MIKEKITKAGKLLDIDFYPCWSDGRRLPTCKKKSNVTSEAQQKYNENKSQKELVYVVNENFDETDYITTYTYAPEYAPQSEDEVKRDFYNNTCKIRRARKRELKKIEAELEALPDVEELAELRKELEHKREKLSEPFKYVYVVETITYQRGPHKGKNNYHIHAFMTGGLERSQIEKMWKKGIRSNVDQFQPDRFGPETMAKYMMKDPKGYRRFCCSRNMSRTYKQPKKKDSRFSAAGVAKLAQERVDDAAYWEKRYKGYRFVRSFPRFNEYNGHWYMTVVMYAAGDGPVPKWNMDNWPNDDWQNER